MRLSGEAGFQDGERSCARVLQRQTLPKTYRVNMDISQQLLSTLEQDGFGCPSKPIDGVVKLADGDTGGAVHVLDLVESRVAPELK